MKKNISAIHAFRKRKMLSRCQPIKADTGSPQFSASGVVYDVARRSNAIACGGLPLLHQVCECLGLKREIDSTVHILKQHQPYHESDHVLNIAFNILAGGTCLDHLELRRRYPAYLDALGTHSIPDPTTAGDFCRRFEGKAQIDILQEAINRARVKAWQAQDEGFFAQAVIDADGVLCGTEGECKQGMDIAYDGTWGYHALIVSLANTGEPLYLANRPGSRPSHEGAAEYFSKAAALCRSAGFRKVRFRGDTDFTQSRHLDEWHRDGWIFNFGIDARDNLVRLAESFSPDKWHVLTPRESELPKTEERAKRENAKDKAVDARGFKHLRTVREEVAQTFYLPGPCSRTYRLVVVRKTIEVTQGLFKNLAVETRHFFYLTNDWKMTPDEIVHDARQRCDQENLNAQMKRGVHALAMPLDNLHSNWAYAVMAALAWSVKAWAALLLPVDGRWRERHESEKRKLLRMEFPTFLQALINIPAQVVRSGRRLVMRLLNWNEWCPAFFRLERGLAQPLRC